MKTAVSFHIFLGSEGVRCNVSEDLNLQSWAVKLKDDEIAQDQFMIALKN